MTAQDKPTIVATKIDPATNSELETVAAGTGLKTADILRIGLRKVLKEYATTGKLQIGEEAA